MFEDSYPDAGGQGSSAARPLDAPALNAEWAVGRKMRAAASGRKLRLLDLFSGCGGLSLGFHREGFRIVGNVEADAYAARSHALNFHGASQEELHLHAKPRDITAVEPVDLALELGLGAVEDAIDVIVGGPPCQAYARVGRAKLSQVADNPDAFKVDARRNLYLRYLHYVSAFRPLALLMENVPDILNQHGHNVVEEMVAILNTMGYDARYTLTNAAYHGVPQTRERVFILAFRKELKATIRFPTASHYVDLPQGYTGTRSHALKTVRKTAGTAYLPADSGGVGLPHAVTAAQAIGDLPAIHGMSAGRGPQRFRPDLAISYPDRQPSEYAQLMRGWPGFEAPDGLVDHVIRRLPRDYLIFGRMPQGAEYPAAHGIATRLFQETAARRGHHPESREYADLKAAMVPPYDPSKFPNRWWKMREDFPVRTLMAHLSQDAYSHIHYDDWQQRTLSVREAARLQSFPDGWKFAGTMNPAFKQIGNAVPPLLAAAMARTMRDTLAESLAPIHGASRPHLPPPTTLAASSAPQRSKDEMAEAAN